MSSDHDIFEVRILKSTCVILIISSVAASMINYFLDLGMELVLITLGLSVISFGLWWMLHRYRNFEIVRLILSILIIGIINLAWYFNFTSHGPVLGLFSIFIILIIFIWPLRFAFFLTAGALINILILFYFDWTYHPLFPQYPSDAAQLTDMYFGTFVIMIIAMSFSYIAKSNYLKKLFEAQKADKAKTAFLHNMSHELRTPMNAINGFSEVIATEDLSKEEMVELALRINKSGLHLLELIEDIFEITSIDLDELILKIEDVELNNWFNEIEADIQKEVQKYTLCPLPVLFSAPSECQRLTIRTDPFRLKQIIIHLIRNALKFTADGKIEYGYFFNDTMDSSVPVLFVTDTGIGIPRDKIDHVFDLFEKNEGTKTKLHSGVGLGLSVSKKLVEYLGGKIWVESTVGAGTTFYFTISST